MEPLAISDMGSGPVREGPEYYLQRPRELAGGTPWTQAGRQRRGTADHGPAGSWIEGTPGVPTVNCTLDFGLFVFSVFFILNGTNIVATAHVWVVQIKWHCAVHG